MSSIEKWEQKQPCPGCGVHIVCDLLNMHLELECEGADEDEKEEDLVHTIRSHLSEDVIIWSSDPKSMPPTLGYQPKDVPGSLFFVNTPKKSEASRGWETELDKAAQIIDSATAILIVAGAGIGVDSGLPDYRGPSGFWRAYPALEKLGLSIEDISHPDWFSKDPLFAWGFYGHRADLYNKAVPHEGFKALKEMVDAKNGNYFIFTSNIDGQFQKAGFDEERIYECHGSLGHLQCLNGCSFNEVWQLDPDGALPEVDMKTMKAKKSTIPKCPKCKSTARPNVSMFGDTSASWNPTRSEKQRHRLLAWLKEAFPYSHEGKFDIISSEPLASTNSLAFPHDSTTNTITNTITSTITNTIKVTTRRSRKNNKNTNSNNKNETTTVNYSSVDYEKSVDIVQKKHQQKRESSTLEETDTQITIHTNKKKKINSETITTTRRGKKQGKGNEDPEEEVKQPDEKITQTTPKLEPTGDNEDQEEHEEKSTKKEEQTKQKGRRRTKTNNIEEAKQTKQKEEEDKTNQNPKFEPMVTRKRGRLMDLERQGKRLVIIECGCGVSLHSIRIESEALLRNSRETDKGERVRLVRLNPTDWEVPPGRNVGLGLGAKAGLLGILKRLECTSSTDTKQTP
eukprot:Phypoly_transcript_04316.p1 GENE.Phypoly_transcript_04316~~Phypoly_transcript_04316.p1  ORF type:complete len:624 (-),score=105.90 Phypoly_transcript_04316:242-2113(-)